jgi:hypothetical protein
VVFLMERQMLLGIKARAEGTRVTSLPVQFFAWAGWVAAAVTVTAFCMSRRRVFWLALPLAAAVPILLTTTDAVAALAAYVALANTVGGAVRFGWRWWPALALTGAPVLLVLLLATDAFAALGLVFLVLLAAAGGRWLNHRGGLSLTLSGRRPADIAH